MKQRYGNIAQLRSPDRIAPETSLSQTPVEAVKLNFEVENLFCIGSPLSMFLTGMGLKFVGLLRPALQFAGTPKIVALCFPTAPIYTTYTIHVTQ